MKFGVDGVYCDIGEHLVSWWGLGWDWMGGRAWFGGCPVMKALGGLVGRLVGRLDIIGMSEVGFG